MERAERSHRLVADPPATCPRATRAFVGREAELGRIADLLDDEVLFLIYGVAGIGKSELAYRALELARERPDWQDAVSTFVQVQPGMNEKHLVALLRLRTGADGAHADRLGGPAPSLSEELEPVVHALNARPRLLFLDDVHLIEGEAVARVLDHLARRVRSSRLFVASRLEIPFAAGGTTPVVTRLAPLEEPAARRMLAHLGRRLGVDVVDVSGILTRSGGSPFFIQREVASALANAAEPAADRLESTLLDLPAAARRLLLRAAVICDRVGVAELTAGGPPIDGSLSLLARHFFIELGEGTVAVHDLVRGAVFRLASPVETLRARRAAARIFVGRTIVGGAEGALATVEAVRMMCAAGDHDEAFAFIAERHGTVSGAGLDHLLVESLEELRAAAPAHATAIDMVLARILVRRALVSEAQEVLSRLAADGKTASSVRYLTLAGTIAAQRGDLRGAETCLQGAHDAARPDAAGSAERARIALHLADVLSLRGETARARAVLEDVRQVCEARRGRTVLRWGWSAALSWVLEKDFARTIATVAPFRELAVQLGAADLAAQLTMLEVLARAELHDAAGARTLTDQIVAPAAQAGALRAPIASFYVGVATWAEGDLRTAAVALRNTWTFLEAHHHEVLAPIVGHYLARVALALGDIPTATDLFERTTRRAAEVGMGSLTAVGAVYHARALVAAGDTPTARSLAGQALAEVADGNRGATAYTRHIAHRVLALVSALEGDLAAARDHLADALTCAGAEAAHRIDTALDRADVELCGGDAAAVVQAASTARNHYAGRGRRFLEARACVAVAAGHAALGGPGDLAMAEEALARADDLSARYGYETLHLRIVLVRAAMLGRRGDRSQAERLLTEALASGAARPGGITLLLCSALGSGRDHQLPAGLAAQLVLLGLRRQAAPPEADVIVDPRKVTISSRHTVVKGRPIACALLACLVEGQGEPVPADVLYCTVWGVAEYHALRHRNTLYVALNRLRQTLSELCADREGDLIETLPAGWRLAEGLVARNAVTGASCPSPS